MAKERVRRQGFAGLSSWVRIVSTHASNPNALAYPIEAAFTLSSRWSLCSSITSSFWIRFCLYYPYQWCWTFGTPRPTPTELCFGLQPTLDGFNRLFTRSPNHLAITGHFDHPITSIRLPNHLQFLGFSYFPRIVDGLGPETTPTLYHHPPQPYTSYRL